jgi:hypothetical protein
VQLFERSSGKAFLRLTKAIVLLTTAYAILTVMPWYLLPLGWVITGTCFASVRRLLSCVALPSKLLCGTIVIESQN